MNTSIEQSGLAPWTAVAAMRDAYGRSTINRAVHPADGGMADPTPKDREHYWADGASAMDLIFKAMLLAGHTGPPKRILDMPSGYGRVARHLVAAFPSSHLTVCDIDWNALAFCNSQFGAQAILSQVNLDAVTYDAPFGLIWSGSLLSHLPKHRFRQALDLYSRYLGPGGIAVVTTHGRFSAEYGRDNYAPAGRFSKAAAAFHADGFGYVDYENPDQSQIGEYGVALSSPAFVTSTIARDTTLRVLALIERGWNSHQDVLVLQKAPIF